MGLVSSISYHLTVTGLLVHYGDVGPSEQFDESQHCLSLVLIGRDGSHKKWVPLHGAQGRARRKEAHLELIIINILNVRLGLYNFII